MGTFLDQTSGDPNDPTPIERLGRAEAPRVPGMIQGVGAKRCFRALKRLEDVLATMPGGGEGP